MMKRSLTMLSLSIWMLILVCIGNVQQQSIRVIKSLDELKRQPRDESPTMLRLNKKKVRELFQVTADELAGDELSNRPHSVLKRALNSSVVHESNQTKINDTASNKLALAIGTSKSLHSVDKKTKIALKVSQKLINIAQQINTQLDETTVSQVASAAVGFANLTLISKTTPPSYNTSVKYNTYLSQYQAPAEFCPNIEKIFCDFAYPYRTMDGSCNNVRNVWWGRKETPYKRLLYPAYQDGLNFPRLRSVTGNELPNPRTVALVVHTTIEHVIPQTNLLTHFSQFVAHDLSLIALISDSEGNPIKCFCNNEDTDCLNIVTPSNDPFNIDQRCMVTPRSSASFRLFNCDLGAREQINLLSHWLDLSQTYGNDLERSFFLRKFRGGRLRVSKIRELSRVYLPFNKKGVCFGMKGKVCFESGDVRTNQNLLLVAMQTIWLREHNRVADRLALLNPFWPDEILFQETRKIVIAKYQHIIFNEWLPLIIGEQTVDLYGLKPLNQDYLYKYTETIYPNIANEFAAAAFRFGHSMVRSYVRKLRKNYSFMRNITIDDLIMNSLHAFKRGGLDSLARGCILDRSYAFDTQFSDSLANHLFEEKFPDTQTHRYSLPALNINRGRDHGLQPYNFYRELCGLNRAYSFDDLYNIPKKVRTRLALVYEHVDDIDLFTGGTSELPIRGGVVGPTFACIIAKQFRDLKFGDRFYYENGELNSYRLTVDQLDSIRKSNMARILCDNLDIDFIQLNPFRPPDRQLNPLISCKRIQRVSLRPWKIYTY